MGRGRWLSVGLVALLFLALWRADVFGTAPFADWLFLVPAWLLGFAAASFSARARTPTSASYAPSAVFQGREEDLSGLVDPASRDLETVEGIGPGYGRRLRSLGVDDTLALVERCAAPEAQSELAIQLKVEPLVVQRWTSMADLLRIPGMDGQSAEVLEAAGVRTVAALAERQATDLVGVLLDVNARLRLTPDDLPGVDQIENWIGLASLLPDVIEAPLTS